jgi:PAS domain S-box-containing protein
MIALGEPNRRNVQYCTFLKITSVYAQPVQPSADTPAVILKRRGGSQHSLSRQFPVCGQIGSYMTFSSDADADEVFHYLQMLDQKCDMFNHLPMAAYVVRADGVVVWYNARAAELWGRKPAVGDTDERFCGAHTLFHPDGTHMAHCDTPVALALSTGASVHEEEVIIGRPDGSRVHVSVYIDPIRNPRDGRTIGVVNYFNDLTERKRREAEREQLLQEAETSSAELRETREELESKVEQRTNALRRLSSHLMHVQDEQSRRIARELQDSIGQYLAALGMNLAQFEKAKGPKTAETLAECRQLLGRCVTETRTLSHLLHPPLLEEAGFASAARDYVEEFARRSGIETDISLDLPYRLPADTEILLFRVLQESLTFIATPAATAQRSGQVWMEKWSAWR